MRTLNELKQTINTIVKEEFSKHKKKVDLAKIFDLDKIPEEELKKQYYDISLVHSFSGYGSHLLKVNNKYITENDSRVRPANEVKRELDLKYNLSPWQIKIIERGHDIQICLCIANFMQGINDIINDMEQMGYFLSVSENVQDSFQQVWVKMQFEPKYQMDENNKILSYGDLYHLTPIYNLKDIQTNGLTPSSKNGMFNYPNRIYFFIGNTPIQEIGILGKQLYAANKDPRNNGQYILLKIDSERLRDKVELHYDPNYPYGVFTEDTISSSFISIFKQYTFR